MQRAVAMVLEAVYEQDFRGCSYGFRPRRSAHQALEALREGLMDLGGGFVLELDIERFFDALDRPRLREILRQRVRDGVLLRLIGKWLEAGVLEERSFVYPETGTPQGGVISPLLANVFLDTVLDVWFEDVVRPRLRGRALLVRYADDAVMVFSGEEDARRVWKVLAKRFEKYGLLLHPEKTRLLRFGRPSPRGPPSWRSNMKLLVRALCILAIALACGAPAPPEPRPGAVSDWPSYGGIDGQRFAAADEITRENVGELAVAWTHRHGDVSDGKGDVPSTTAFEATPILAEETLYYCTPMNRVVALDARSGRERWSHDPKVDLSGRYANQLTCRGVETWLDPARGPGAPCGRRIFTATNDGRFLALDARSGAPCADFGAEGTVDLGDGVGEIAWLGEYQVTSPPTAAGDLVIVGSAISDGVRTGAPSGVVRAYDARSGALRWAFDLAPPGYERTPENSTSRGWALGTPNVWAPMVLDAERDLVFLPTGNPTPDYFRGETEIDHYGSSVVALRASTGEVVWRSQTVRRDLWDYDLPAQPTLATLSRDGESVPVVIQATKMGLLFVLHRETGEAVFGVGERPVPQDGVAGERLSPTQPFPLAPPPLVPHALSPADAWGFTPFDRAACRRALEALRYDGIYTPPTLQGSLMFPGNAGGSNWGGVAVHPGREVLVANTMSLAWAVRLFPSADYEREKAARPGEEVAPQRGTPYGLHRWVVLSPFGVPCNPPPWGTLAAVDLARGTILWQVPLGTIRDATPLPIPWKLGVPNAGGPLVTAGGLVFIGAAMDDYLRAFDLETGEELWKGRLPAGGQATPMSYRLDPDGRQYVVIAAGGHGKAGTRLGDSLVAFTLGGDAGGGGDQAR